ncbi:MAG: DNA translocase FtsK 4TM domain-containing protein, partial [bacterium]|nr:DNA translocase FtsK 4TM domain-containing protein [bacterium]
MDKKKKLQIIGVLQISLSVFVFLSLVFFLESRDKVGTVGEIVHRMGFVGSWVSRFLFKTTVGYASFVFPVLLLLWGVHFLFSNRIATIRKITLIMFLFGLYIAGGLALFNIASQSAKFQGTGTAPFEVNNYQWGAIAGSLARLISNWFGVAGSFIILITIVIITVLFSFDLKLGKIKSKFKRWMTILIAIIFRRYDRRLFKPNQPTPSLKILFARSKKKERKAEKDFPTIRMPADESETATEQQPAQSRRSRLFTAKKGEHTQPTSQPLTDVDRVERLKAAKKYQHPEPTLLDDPTETVEQVSWDDLMTSAKTLEEKLADFGIHGKVVEINPGPVITRFEIEPAPGVKISRFTSLADDLALVMRAKRIR